MKKYKHSKHAYKIPTTKAKIKKEGTLSHKVLGGGLLRLPTLELSTTRGSGGLEKLARRLEGC